MRFLIVGAGAVGGYVGGSLALGGHAVTFLARPATATSLRADGLRLTDARTGESRSLSPIVAVTPAEVQASGPYDCAVLATKAFDTDAAATSLRAALPSLPPILCLQNGVDAEAALANVFGAGAIISGTVTTALSKPGPGDITIERSRGIGVALGHPLSDPLVAAFNGAGIRAQAYAEASPMKWSKLLTNLIGNATSAILDMTVAEVLGDPRLFGVEMASLRECLAVMTGLGLTKWWTCPAHPFARWPSPRGCPPGWVARCYCEASAAVGAARCRLCISTCTPAGRRPKSAGFTARSLATVQSPAFPRRSTRSCPTSWKPSARVN